MKESDNDDRRDKEIRTIYKVSYSVNAICHNAVRTHNNKGVQFKNPNNINNYIFSFRCISYFIHNHIPGQLHQGQNGKSNGFTILPHCKTPAGDRRLQLNNQAIELFDKTKALNDANGLPTGLDDFVFLRNVKGEITSSTPRCFDHRLRKYCKQADMTVIKSPHDVRRTVLTNLYTAGMPLKKIQEFAGHSSLKQTMDYIRISDEDIDLSEYLNTLSDTTMIENSNIVPFKKEA